MYLFPMTQQFTSTEIKTCPQKEKKKKANSTLNIKGNVTVGLNKRPHSFKKGNSYYSTFHLKATWLKCAEMQ